MRRLLELLVVCVIGCGGRICTMWLSCVQNCEQQNQSAFACSQTQGPCGPPQNIAENALFKCAQQFCGNTCTVD